MIAAVLLASALAGAGCGSSSPGTAERSAQGVRKTYAVIEADFRARRFKDVCERFSWRGIVRVLTGAFMQRFFNGTGLPVEAKRAEYGLFEPARCTRVMAELAAHGDHPKFLQRRDRIVVTGNSAMVYDEERLGEGPELLLYRKGRWHLAGPANLSGNEIEVRSP